MTPTATDLFAHEGLIQALLNVSLTPLCLLRPVYAAGSGELSDFAFDYLNLAGQRMSGLPERAGGTLLAHFPSALQSGSFTFYRDTFLSGEAGRHEVNYQTDGPDNYFRMAARRHGPFLLVSLTDTGNQDRTAVEMALRASRAREKAALAEAEQERNLLQAVLTQAPVGIGLLQGDDLVVSMANEQLCRMWGRTPSEVLGQSLLAAVPELRGQGFEELLADVVRTKRPFAGTVAVQLRRDGQLATHYFNVVYQPMRGLAGGKQGVLNLVIDVTEQVQARQQVQQLNTKLEARVAERTQAALVSQAEAERQRARLEQLFMGAPAAIAIHSGPELVFELVNPAYQAFMPGRQLLNLPLVAAVPEVRNHSVFNMLSEVYATGVSQTAHSLLVSMASSESGQLEDRYFTFVAQVRRDEYGRIDGVLQFAFEVTELVLARQRAEALQVEVLVATHRQVEERETFHQIFEQTPAVIALLRGPEHRLAYFNEAYRRLFPNRDLLGRSLVEARPELAAQGFAALMDRVYETGETYHRSEFAMTVEAVNGQPPQTHYFDFTYQAYRENGQIVGLSLFAYDITEQVLASQEREAQQRQLHELFEQAPVAIAVFRGPQYKIELANPAVCALWGRTQAQALHAPLFELLPESAGHGFEQLLDEVMATGIPYVANALPMYIDRNGHRDTVYMNFVYQPLRENDAGITAITLVATDVTEQVTTRQQLAATIADLSASNQLLTRANTDLANFIYTASHDLKTPIANIEGLLTILCKQLPIEARQGLVQNVLGMMQSAVERFQLTITQLTDITRLQQAHAQIAEVVDLAALSEAVWLDLAPLLATNNARLTVDVVACPSIFFAPKNLRSIVHNLLSNAVKYHAPNRSPVVQLRAHRASAATVLEVQDNGLGLSKLQQDRLYGMFQRLHDHVEGSGIGLYMVKRIVDNAGGTIAVQSEPSIGSTFTITLPD